MVFRSYIVGICLLSLCANKAKSQSAIISNDDVRWHTQSKNSSESMPCGGGDIGLNVWVENGDLLFYVSQSGTFDENNQMLKLGRVRVSIPDAPLTNKGFEQRLRLKTGDVTILDDRTKIHIWVDVFKPVVHVDVNNKTAQNILVSYESWRSQDHLVKGKELRANSYKVPQKFDVFTYKDSIFSEKEKITFYHRNRNDVRDVFDYTVQMEGMDSVKSQLYNPILDNTFGGVLYAKNMQPYRTDTGTYINTPYKSWTLKTLKKVRSQELTIALNTGQFASQESWQKILEQTLQAGLQNTQKNYNATCDWWTNYWDKSYIHLDGKESWITQNYNLFRYQLGCNAFGKWPTKFNGGLFTFDPVFVDTQYHFTPDFRLWGGGTMTAQNQRLVYWGMLKNGDLDLMQPQFDFYLHNLKNAELRSQVYWKHDGACFTEQLENFGLPNIFEYTPKRPADYDKGVEYNAWLEYEWETVFEFCKMILDARVYGDYDIHKYIPLIESCLTFYDQHYRYLASKRSNRIWNDKGQYVFYPSSAAETYKMAYNSTTVISALCVILSNMIALPEKYLNSDKKTQWSEMLKRIPDVPLRQINGQTVLAPAENWERIQNTESPQLYPVFPWGIYGIGKVGLDTAIQTYRLDSQIVKTRSAVGWRQHNIFAARLGLAEEAEALTSQKMKQEKHRFPTFWGPGFDWTPDHNWGGSAMIGLQEMLLQTDGKKMFLLPAWPADWNGNFKLHAPYQTTVEATIKNGKIETLNVFPKERLGDVFVKKGTEWVSFVP